MLCVSILYLVRIYSYSLICITTRIICPSLVSFFLETYPLLKTEEKLWAVLFEIFSFNYSVLLVALEVVKEIYEGKDDWPSLFRPSDFFQKYK